MEERKLALGGGLYLKKRDYKRKKRVGRDNQQLQGLSE